jgi:hypothetical protein
MEKDLKVKALHNIADWVVNCSEDICQVCAYYDPLAQAAALDENEDQEPCVFRRTNGKVACRNGIIEYFQGVSTDGGLDMQGEPAQQPTYTGEEKPF